jgi:AcrR family transcriptional regulator
MARGTAKVKGHTAARLSKSARREQLLEVAAEMLAEQGTPVLTMEGLAERAGVSKALPYSHFTNADDVLIALYQSEILRMGDRVARAQQAETSPEARLVAAVHAYFDVVQERGAVLAVLMGPGSAIPRLADQGDNVGQRFVADLLTQTFGIKGKQALVLADILQGSLSGAVTAWANGTASRSTAEKLVTAFVLSGLRDAAGSRPGR